MRERTGRQGVDREVRVEGAREWVPVGVRDEPQERAVTFEGPEMAGIDGCEGGFRVAVDEAGSNRARGCLKGELRVLFAEPLALQNLGGPAGG